MHVGVGRELANQVLKCSSKWLSALREGLVPEGPTEGEMAVLVTGTGLVLGGGGKGRGT